MADAKIPTRPPPPRSRGRRDPREESTPPPRDELGDVRPPPARPDSLARMMRTGDRPSQHPHADSPETMQQLANFEDEVGRLREQREVIECSGPLLRYSPDLNPIDVVQQAQALPEGGGTQTPHVTCGRLGTSRTPSCFEVRPWSVIRLLTEQRLKSCPWSAFRRTSNFN